MAYFFVIDGVHGIGKTTMAKKLSRRLALPLATEGAEEILQIINPYTDIKMLPVDVYKMFEEGLWKVKIAQYASLDDFYDDSTIVIADRSFISTLAYCKVLLGSIDFLEQPDIIEQLTKKFFYVLLLRPSKKFLEGNVHANLLKEIDHYIWKYYTMSPARPVLHSVFIDKISDTNKIYKVVVKGLKKALAGGQE